MARKKMPPAVKPRAKVKACSDQEPDKASVKKRKRPAVYPGEEFWIRGSAYGWEFAFEREPDLPHITVKVVTDGSGREFEQTWTRTRKVRTGDGSADFITPRPRGEGWEPHELPQVETYDTFGVWRRPISTGWEECSKDSRFGRTWQRGGPPPERIIATYHIIERPEGGERVRRKVKLIDTGTAEGLVEETASPEMLWGIGLGWQASGNNDDTWRRPYVKKKGGRS